MASGKATAYSPQTRGSSMEGGLTSSRRGPDGSNYVRTLSDYASGASPYVTVAGNPSLYGSTYTIPSITYVDKNGVTQTLTNVPAVVHDTGGDFRNAPEGRFDVPVGKDMSASALNAQPFSGQRLGFNPVGSLAEAGGWGNSIAPYGFKVPSIPDISSPIAWNTINPALNAYALNNLGPSISDGVLSMAKALGIGSDSVAAQPLSYVSDTPANAYGAVDRMAFGMPPTSDLTGQTYGISPVSVSTLNPIDTRDYTNSDNIRQAYADSLMPPVVQNPGMETGGGFGDMPMAKYPSAFDLSPDAFGGGAGIPVNSFAGVPAYNTTGFGFAGLDPSYTGFNTPGLNFAPQNAVASDGQPGPRMLPSQFMDAAGNVIGEAPSSKFDTAFSMFAQPQPTFEAAPISTATNAVAAADAAAKAPSPQGAGFAPQPAQSMGPNIPSNYGMGWTLNGMQPMPLSLLNGPNGAAFSGPGLLGALGLADKNGWTGNGLTDGIATVANPFGLVGSLWDGLGNGLAAANNAIGFGGTGLFGGGFGPSAQVGGGGGAANSALNNNAGQMLNNLSSGGYGSNLAALAASENGNSGGSMSGGGGGILGSIGSALGSIFSGGTSSGSTW